MQLLAVERRAAAARRQQTHQGADRRGLAHAVAAEQRHDLAGADVEAHVEQHLRGAVAGCEFFDREHALHLLAEIGGDHLRVGAHLRRRAARQDAAVDQHRDAVRQREHRVHVVLDQHHREAALQAAQRRDQPLGLVAAGAGHRLVEQQQLRLHRQRDRELQRALLAVRELAGRHVGALGEADLRERGQRGRVQRRLVGRATEEAEARPRARLHGERDVLQHREARQDRGDLERAREPARGARVHRQRASRPRRRTRCARRRARAARRSG